MALEHRAPGFEARLCQPAQLAAQLAALPRPLVFTNGCFDILHRGHVTYLAQARALGASLVVGVNSDASVRRLGKAGDRPLNTLEDRMAVLAALESVSLVVGFDEDTPLDLIRQVQPDVLVKGGDWTPDRIVGAEDVLARGGQVHSIPFRHERSTTALLEKIRKR
jgi:rfaE bifunctional protein nucleotidyltransferase chain/domain